MYIKNLLKGGACSLVLLALASACNKSDDKDNSGTPSTQRTNYISFKQNGIPIEIDSVYTSSTVIISGVFKGVKIVFFDKARNKYDFSLADSNLNLNYVTPKRYEGSGNSFIHLKNGQFFSSLSSQSYFTCTESDPATKSFSGLFQILLLNAPNNTDTIRLTEGLMENIRLP